MSCDIPCRRVNQLPEWLSTDYLLSFESFPILTDDSSLNVLENILRIVPVEVTGTHYHRFANDVKHL